jgi:ABC-type multidrug transport system ATPase subunit
MPYYFNLALDNGVKPREISEIITHLAFYSGWGNAMSAVALARRHLAELLSDRSGEQTRVSLAKAMLNSPQLLLLDEPTASLDPAIARDIRSKIRDFAAQGTSGVLWTSHNMYEVEEVCDRVLFLSRGRILLEGDPKTLPREHGKATLEELFIIIA